MRDEFSVRGGVKELVFAFGLTWRERCHGRVLGSASAGHVRPVSQGSMASAPARGGSAAVPVAVRGERDIRSVAGMTRCDRILYEVLQLARERLIAGSRRAARRRP
jgi:hypothetical protein